LGLHCYEISTHPDELVLEPPPLKKILDPPMPLFFSFLGFSWLCRLYVSRLMSRPSPNHVSVIKCSQIRKSCRNSSIVGVI